MTTKATSRLFAPIARLLPQPFVGSATAGLAALVLVVSWQDALARGLGGVTISALLLALALSGAVVAAYQFPIHLRHQTKVLLVTLVYYLLAALAPPALAASAAGLGALLGEWSRRKASGAYPSDVAVEVGRRVLIVLPAAVVAHMASTADGRAFVLVGAAIVLAALDLVSAPLALAPMCGDCPFHVLRSLAREAALPEGIQYAAGLVGAFAAFQCVWTLVILVAPAALVYKAFKALHEMQAGTRHLLENMADAVDLRDPYTGGHSRRVAEYSAAILEQLGLNGPEFDVIVAAARVHDIGKIGVPDAVLYKPGPLTAEERALMELHPVHGETLLKRHRDFARGVEIVRHHHESWDGRGYPDRLAGLDIPFGARVIAVADSFDAMTSDRPYRSGMSAEKAVEILRDGRGRQWDAHMVDALLRSLDARGEPANSTINAPDATGNANVPDAAASAGYPAA